MIPCHISREFKITKFRKTFEITVHGQTCNLDAKKKSNLKHFIHVKKKDK